MGFFSETMQIRREWSETFQVLKEKNHQAKILYSTKLLFESKGEIKTLDKNKNWGEFLPAELLYKKYSKKFFKKQKIYI